MFNWSRVVLSCVKESEVCEETLICELLLLNEYTYAVVVVDTIKQSKTLYDAVMSSALLIDTFIADE